MQGGADGEAAGGFLGQAADVHLAPLGQQEGARYGRGGHDEHVGPLALAAQGQALVDAEPVLLVYDRERQITVFHRVLEQRVGADDDLDRSVLDAAQQAGAFLAFHRSGQQRDGNRA